MAAKTAIFPHFAAFRRAAAVDGCRESDIHGFAGAGEGGALVAAFDPVASVGRRGPLSFAAAPEGIFQGIRSHPCPPPFQETPWHAHRF